MYEIDCDECGRVGFHPSRLAAEARASTHNEKTGHDCGIQPMKNV